MRIDWGPLEAAMAGRETRFWWRDDDAVAATPELERLMAITEEVGAPLTLAAIPAQADGSLTRAVAGRDVRVAVHGWAHADHAPSGEKKAEFGAHRPLPERMAEAERGLARLREGFGASALPVFIPPWNRMAGDMPETLAAAGFEGVSVYGEDVPRRDPLARFDAHLDPVDWRGGRSAVDPAGLVARAAGLVAAGRPVGLMTHHLMHDAAVCELVEAFARGVSARGARWVSLADLLAGPDGR